MVAFGFCRKSFGSWRGPKNDIVSFYECILSGGHTMMACCSYACLCPTSHLVKVLLPNMTRRSLVFFKTFQSIYVH